MFSISISDGFHIGFGETLPITVLYAPKYYRDGLMNTPNKVWFTEFKLSLSLSIVLPSFLSLTSILPAFMISVHLLYEEGNSHALAITF